MPEYEMTATTKVTVEMTTGPPTIADVRKALDILTADGVPETFEVSIVQAVDREYAPDVPYADRKVTYTFRVEAERAARTKP